MSIMKSIRNFFGHKDQTPVVEDTSPLRIKLGSLVTMNQDFRVLVAGSSKVNGLGRDESVFAKGEIDLGEGATLHRFYFDNEDFMLQIRTSGYAENVVEEVILFNYLEVKSVSTEHELQRLAGRESPIGLPTYNLDGVTYQRAWGTEPGQTELVLLREKIDNKTESYNVKHMCMLYGRETDLSERAEFLLLSVEESGGTDGEDYAWHITTSLGLTLFANDLTVL